MPTAGAGLLRASFVPPKPIRQLRNLTRYRKTQIHERQREVNPLHKALEDAGIKLYCVASDILRKSARDMLYALVARTTDPDALADLARRQMRQKIPPLREALQGHFDAHHRLWIRSILRHIVFLDEHIEQLSAAIEEQIRPFSPAVELLRTIDRLPAARRRVRDRRDRRRHVDLRHRTVTWRPGPAQCSGNDESAGKRRSGNTRNGSKWLDYALEEASLPRSASRTATSPRNTAAQASPRTQEALGAVKHTMICAIWHMLPPQTYPPPAILHPPRTRTPDQAPRRPARTPRHHVTLKSPQPERTFPVTARGLRGWTLPLDARRYRRRSSLSRVATTGLPELTLQDEYRLGRRRQRLPEDDTKARERLERDVERAPSGSSAAAPRCPRSPTPRRCRSARAATTCWPRSATTRS